MPPSEQQQDGIIDGEGTRIEDKFSITKPFLSQSHSTSRSNFPSPLHSSNSSRISLGTSTLAHTQLFASQGQYYQKNLQLEPSFTPPKSLFISFQLINKLGKNQFHGNRTIISESILPTHICGALWKFSRCSSDKHMWKEQS